MTIDPNSPTSVFQRGLVIASPLKRVRSFRRQPGEKQEAQPNGSLEEEVDPEPEEGIQDGECGIRTIKSEGKRRHGKGGSQTYPPKSDLLSAGQTIERNRLLTLNSSEIDILNRFPVSGGLEVTVPEG